MSEKRLIYCRVGASNRKLRGPILPNKTGIII